LVQNADDEITQRSVAAVGFCHRRHHRRQSWRDRRRVQAGRRPSLKNNLPNVAVGLFCDIGPCHETRAALYCDIRSVTKPRSQEKWDGRLSASGQ
jgi:hypothetical protein